MTPQPDTTEGGVTSPPQNNENDPLLPTTNTARSSLRSRNSHLSAANSADPSERTNQRSSFNQFVEVLSVADEREISRPSDIESGFVVPSTRRASMHAQAREDSRLIRGSVAVLDSDYEQALEQKHPKIIQFLTSYKGIILQILICVCTGALDLYETVFRQKSADVKRANPVTVDHKCTGQSWKWDPAEPNVYDPFYMEIDSDGKKVFKISKYGASSDPTEGRGQNYGMWCLRAKYGKTIDSFEDLPVTFKFGGEEREFDNIDELRAAWDSANRPQGGTPEEDDIIRV